MDLFEQWKKIEESKVISNPIKKEEVMEAIYRKSTGTMETLRKRLLYKMIWVVFFIVTFIAMLIFTPANVVINLIFGIAILFYLIGAAGLYRYYHKMGAELSGETTLGVLKKNYRLVKDALNFESVLMYPLIPFMLVGGMILPGLLDGQELSNIVGNNKFVVIMLIGLAVLVPMFIWVSKKMNKLAYGSYMDKLQDHIQEMEEVI